MTSSHSFAAENGKATPFMKCIIEKLFQPVGCFVVFLKNLQLGKPVQRATSWQGETPSQNYPPILGKSQIKVDVLSSRFFPKLLLFKFHWVHVLQRGMTAPAVVKHLDVIDDILPGSKSAEVPPSKNLLNFEAAEETLRHCVIPVSGSKLRDFPVFLGL